MTHKNLTEKTSCNCKNSCDVPQGKNKTKYKKGLLAFMAAMAICCIAPLGIGFFAVSATALPLAIWFGNPIVYIVIAVIVGLALWYYLKIKP